MPLDANGHHPPSHCPVFTQGAVQSNLYLVRRLDDELELANLEIRRLKEQLRVAEQRLKAWEDSTNR